jgi:hypothetical protein
MPWVGGPQLCAVCGLRGPKSCAQCKTVGYCSKAHQVRRFSASLVTLLSHCCYTAVALLLH